MYLIFSVKMTEIEMIELVIRFRNISLKTAHTSNIIHILFGDVFYHVFLLLFYTLHTIVFSVLYFFVYHIDKEKRGYFVSR